MATLTLLVLRTADLAATRAFYEAIGLVLADEKHGAGPAHLAATLEHGLVLELYPLARGQTPDATRLGLRVASIARALDRLSALGVVPVGAGPVVVDPDGRKVVLTE